MRAVVLLCLAAFLAACDSLPPNRDAVVVQAFVETGQPLPNLTVTRTGRLDGAPAPVNDAVVTLEVGASTIRYLPVSAEPGVYGPARPRSVEAGEAFSVVVLAEGRDLRAVSVAPPSIRLDSLRVTPSTAPVRAAFADSLGAPLREGFLYTVDVTLYWAAPPGPDTSWVRARLRPPAAFPSAVVDFLLRTEDTRPEAALATETPGRRAWLGVYAVPVEGPESPLPPHGLDVALLRSGSDYARFALSRDEPGRREPVGNVRGGLGIVAGVSVDRRTVEVAGDGG